MINRFNRNKSNIVKLLLKVIFASFLLYLILSWYDLKSILRELQDVSMWLYSLVVLGHFVLLAIKALRWKILLASFGIICTYPEVLKAYVAAFSVGVFTPGQFGDMAKVMLIDGAKGKRKLALIPSFADRAWDLLGLAGASFICVIFSFSVLLNKTAVIYSVVAMSILLLATLPFLQLVRKLIIRKKNVDIALVFKTSHWVGLLSFVVVIVQFIRWAILAQALAMPVVMAASSAMIGNLVALIPVSFGGLGTREAAVAWLFNYAGLSPEAGVGFSLMMFGAYLIGALFGSVVLGCYGPDVLQVLKKAECE